MTVVTFISYKIDEYEGGKFHG